MDSSNNQQKHELIASKQVDVAVVLVPFPAQGHLNQLLQLACLISSSYGPPVHYVGSAIHNNQARTRANALDTTQITNINFHDLPTPTFHSPPPDPNASKKFPGHLQPLFEASLHLRQPVAEILQTISSSFRRIIVVYDFLMAAVVQDAASLPNAECIEFNCLSAFHHCLFLWEGRGRPFDIETLPKELPSLDQCITNEFMNFLHLQLQHTNFRAGVLFNTSRLVEGTYIDLMSREEIRETQKLWPIGPLLPIRSNSLSTRQDKCLSWLNEQPPDSVLYVSFGTTNSMSNEEINELAMGLEDSGQKFIWVLRDADKGDIFMGEDRRIVLPVGFEERTRGRGMVIRDWAPQPEILANPATGGFMSHCGWNSCIESITMGVPIAACPMHSDQPWNALLVTNILKIGLIVSEWTRDMKLVPSSNITSAVRKLMASEEGNEIRKKANELGLAVRRSTEEGGVSRLELDSFIAHITR